MIDRLASLPYRTRLLLALVSVSLLPVAILGLVALDRATALLRDEQAAGLASAARTAAAYAAGSGRAFDAATANELARVTGSSVALYAPDGTLLATNDGGLLAGSLPAAPPQTAEVVATARGAGRLSAFAAVFTGGGLTGYLELSAPDVAVVGAAADLRSVLAIAIGLAAVVALLLAFALTRDLVRPLRTMSAAVARLRAGDLEARLPVEGDDELAALATSHNRLADALAARNRSLALVLGAIAQLSPSEGVTVLLEVAPEAARRAFGFTAVGLELAGPGGSDVRTSGAGVEPAEEPGTEPAEERIPGEAWAFRTPLRRGDHRVGTLITTLPPTRDWAQADADLLEIFASELAAAIRNAQLFAQVEELSELKSEFLRGVTHNLQTPLTSIRAFAEQLAAEREPAPDRRLGIIVEQADRLSRLVDQLLTVSRLEAGTLHPESEVFALGPLIRRAWESLGRDDHPFELRDEAPGWLASADRDRVDQVVWALLDNALKHGDGPIDVSVRPADTADGLPAGDWLVVTVRDHGPGVPPDDRDRAFERFTRLVPRAGQGTGLGLSVARGLIEAMGGRLWIADADGPGACFAFALPAESIEEA